MGKPLVSADEVASVLSNNKSDDGHAGVDRNTSNRYSLRRPMVIAPEDETAAVRRFETLATRFQEALNAAFDTEIELEPHGFQQVQIRGAIERLTAPTWIMSFFRDGGGGVALGLDSRAALSIFEIALGGTGTHAAEGRDPTRLERSVMTRLARRLGQLISRGTGVHFGGSAFQVGTVPRELGPALEMVGAGLLNIRIDGCEQCGLLMVTPDLLRDCARPADDDSSRDQADSLLARILEVSLDAKPVLCAGRVRLSELSSLKPGSVLRLDADANRPLQLTVRGIPVLSGCIERIDGRGIMRISNCDASPDAEEATAVRRGNSDPGVSGTE